MKFVKEEVEQLTKNGMHTGMKALLGLKLAGCPYVDWYEEIETFLIALDKHRQSFELEPIVPEEIKSHWFSKKIAAHLAESPEMMERLQGAVDSVKKEKGKGPIGFKLEDFKYDPTKVN